MFFVKKQKNQFQQQFEISYTGCYTESRKDFFVFFKVSQWYSETRPKKAAGHIQYIHKRTLNKHCE